MKRVVLGLVAVAGAAISSARAQSLEQNLSQISARAAKHYVTPLASAFAANMNTGWFVRAPAPVKATLQFEGGITTMGAFLGTGARSYRVRDQFNLSRDEARQIADAYVEGDAAYAGWSTADRNRLKDSLSARLASQKSDITIFGPTITGSRGDSTRILFEGSTIVLGGADPFPGAVTSFTLPGGDTVVPGAERGTPVLGMLRSLSNLPMSAPEVTLGTLYGTNLTLRWLPETQSIEQVGALGFFGFGVQHNPQVWTSKPFPVDLAIGYQMQWLRAAGMLHARSWGASVNVSKSYGRHYFNVSPYAGVQFEGAKLDFEYDQSVQRDDGSLVDVPVAFTVNGDNFMRGTLGVSLRVVAITLNGEIGLSKYSTISGGISVGI